MYQISSNEWVDGSDISLGHVAATD